MTLYIARKYPADISIETEWTKIEKKCKKILWEHAKLADIDEIFLQGRHTRTFHFRQIIFSNKSDSLIKGCLMLFFR